MGVSKNRGPPKWMVKIMENPIQMDEFGGTTIFGNIQIVAPSHIKCLGPGLANPIYQEAADRGLLESKSCHVLKRSEAIYGGFTRGSLQYEFPLRNWRVKWCDPFHLNPKIWGS